MTGAETIALADIFVALLVALALVAFVSRRFAVPYTAALVVFGLLVAILAPPDVIEVTPEVVLVVLVPRARLRGRLPTRHRPCPPDPWRVDPAGRARACS